MLEDRLKETAMLHKAELREIQGAAALREAQAKAEVVVLKEELERVRGSKEALSLQESPMIEPINVKLGRLKNALKLNVTFAEATKKQLKKCRIDYGSGRKCYVGSWNGRDVAVSRLSPNHSLVCDANELVALGQGNTNVITYFGSMKLQNGSEYLICEFAELGDLTGVLSKYPRGRVARDVQLEILIQVCSGMEALQKRNLICCGLAARNVLVAEFPTDNPSDPEVAQQVDVKVSGVRLKTIGSGLDECISSGEKKGDDKVNAKNEGRPLRYMAPETLATPPVFSDKSDVWAFGVLIREVLDGCEASVPYGDVVDDDAVVTGGKRFAQTFAP